METKESENLKVCGKYCGECVHCTVGGESQSGQYVTYCHLLVCSIENTDNPLDQCPYCVLEG